MIFLLWNHLHINYNSRREMQAGVPWVNTTRYGLKSFRYEATRIWNSLPNEIRKAESYKLSRDCSSCVRDLFATVQSAVHSLTYAYGCVFSSFCSFLVAFCFFCMNVLLSHLCKQQYQDSAPAGEVGIVTARGGGISFDYCLLVI